MVQARSRDTLSASRLEFVPNFGQWHEPFHYRANLNGAAVFFDDDGYLVNMLDPADLSDFHPVQFNSSVNKDIHASAYRVSFENANTSSSYIASSQPSSHYYNYYLSSDKKRWYAQVSAYSSICRAELYPGINLSVLISISNMSF